MYEKLFVIPSLPKVLSEDELKFYFSMYKTGDVEARNIIITSNIRLVFNRVLKVFINLPYEKNELIEVGLIGLIKAVDTFDYTKNIKFNSYAARCIENEILMFVRKEKRHLIDSIDRNIKVDGKTPLRDKLYCSDNIEEKLEEQDEIVEIRRIIFELPERDRKIITHFFGIQAEKQTQTKIAESLNMSQSNISREIKRILNDLREKINDLDKTDEIILSLKKLINNNLK